VISNVTSFKDLISYGDNTYFTVRKLNGRYINFIDLYCTFRNCKLYNTTGENVAFNPNIMWKEVYFEGDNIYKT
jgi:hypothetical protein